MIQSAWDPAALHPLKNACAQGQDYLELRWEPRLTPSSPLWSNGFGDAEPSKLCFSYAKTALRSAVWSLWLFRNWRFQPLQSMALSVATPWAMIRRRIIRACSPVSAILIHLENRRLLQTMLGEAAGSTRERRSAHLPDSSPNPRRSLHFLR